jgi:hypothetical protein
MHLQQLYFPCNLCSALHSNVRTDRAGEYGPTVGATPQKAPGFPLATICVAIVNVQCALRMA